MSTAVDLHGDAQGELFGLATLIERTSGVLAIGATFDVDVAVPAGANLLHFADVSVLVAQTGAATKGQALFGKMLAVCYRDSVGALQINATEGLQLTGAVVVRAAGGTTVLGHECMLADANTVRWRLTNLAEFGAGVIRVRALVSVMPAGLAMPTSAP